MPSPIDELFPATPREYYERAQLQQVSCQLRFPRILLIAAQKPVQFQEAIRAKFPLYEEGPGPQMIPPVLAGVPSDAAAVNMPPSELLAMIGAQLSGANYRFMTEDRKTTITLTPESFAISTLAYTQWEDFKGWMEAPFAALLEEYKPAFFSRVGLRYIDTIDRDALGLSGTPWSKLVRLAQMAFPELEPHVRARQSQFTIQLPDGSTRFTLRHGYAIKPAAPAHQLYLIDFDFFRTEKTEAADANRTLDLFHEIAGRAFRSCIEPVLRDALRPRPLERAARDPDR